MRDTVLTEKETRNFSTLNEGVLSMLVVFAIGYLHHLYFSYEHISPLFVFGSCLSVGLVVFYQKNGLIASGLLQLFFSSYVLFDQPALFLEQSLFGLAVFSALFACFLAQNNEAVAVEESQAQVVEKVIEKVVEKVVTVDRSEEITKLEKALALKSVEFASLEEEKNGYLEQIQEQEVDIAKLLDSMKEMAERKAVEKVVEVPSKTESKFEAMYKQLSQQFQEKSNVLDETRRELFQKEEEVICLQKKIALEFDGETEAERALIKQLETTTKALEEAEKKHLDELIGYEELIERLLSQLNDK